MLYIFFAAIHLCFDYLFVALKLYMNRGFQISMYMPFLYSCLGQHAGQETNCSGCAPGQIINCPGYTP